MGGKWKEELSLWRKQHCQDLHLKGGGKPDVLVNETESSSLQATFFWAPTTHDVGLFPPRHQSINQTTYYPTCILNLVNLKGIFVNQF